MKYSILSSLNPLNYPMKQLQLPPILQMRKFEAKIAVDSLKVAHLERGSGRTRVMILGHCLYWHTHIIAFHGHCVFPKLNFSSNPARSESISTICPTAFAHLASLCYILLILEIVQTFSLWSYLLWWPVISDLGCYYYSSLKAQVMVRFFSATTNFFFN